MDELGLKKSKNFKLIKAFTNVELLVEYKERNLTIRIYTLDNGSGSPKFNTLNLFSK
jgi:hypothetical protein